MSYDFYLFPLQEGEDLHEAAEKDEAAPSGPPDPEKEERKRRLAAKLVALNPSLEVFSFDYNEIAKLQKISVEEAKTTFRYVEISDMKTGIQITLYDDSASVTVPYWHEGDAANSVFREIWQYLKLICDETGFVAFDPQTDSVVNVSGGFDEMMNIYVDVKHKTEDYVRKDLARDIAPRRPWWKFW